MGWYFYMTGELEPGADAFAEALACPGPTDPGLRALALALYGWLMSNGPNVERAVAFTSEAMAEIDRVDDPWARGMIANLHVITMLFAGFVERVRDALPTLERVAAESDDRWVSAVTKVVRGEVEQYVGDIVVAEQLMLEAADDFEQVGDRFAYAITITEAAEVAEMFGQYDRAVDLLERGVELADEVGFSGHPLAMRARLANVEILRGNLDVAEAHHQIVADDPVAASVPWLQAMSLMGRAAIARRRDQFELAEHVLARAWALPRSKTQPHMRTLLLVARGYLADQIGDGDRALELQAEALRAATGLGAPRNVAYALEGCAGALALADNPERLALGAQLLGAADRLRRDNGGAMPAAERYDVDRAEGRLRSAIGDADFEQAYLAGAAADANDLVAAVQVLAAATTDGYWSPAESGPGQRAVRPWSEALCSISSWPPTGGGRNRRRTPYVKDPVPLGTGGGAHPWRMIGVWLVVAVAVLGLEANVGGETSDDWTIPGTEAQLGADVLEQSFPTEGGVAGRVVFADPDGDVTDAKARAAIEETLAAIKAGPNVLAVTDPFDPTQPAVSPDGRVAYATVRYSIDPPGPAEGEAALDAIEIARSGRAPGRAVA